jgi:hypothetical protein
MGATRSCWCAAVVLVSVCAGHDASALDGVTLTGIGEDGVRVAMAPPALPCGFVGRVEGGACVITLDYDVQECILETSSPPVPHDHGLVSVVPHFVLDWHGVVPADRASAVLSFRTQIWRATGGSSRRDQPSQRDRAVTFRELGVTPGRGFFGPFLPTSGRFVYMGPSVDPVRTARLAVGDEIHLSICNVKKGVRVALSDVSFDMTPDVQ